MNNPFSSSDALFSDDIGPGLSAAELTQAFPFFIQIDDRCRVLALGPGLRAASPALQPGLRLGVLFSVRTATGVVSLDEGLAQSPQRLTLVSAVGASLQMSGPVLSQSGGLLLLLTPDVPTSGESAESAAEGSSSPAGDDWRERALALERVLELAPEGVLHFDAHGMLGHCNAALEGILEMPRDELLGQSLDEVDAVLQACLASHQREPVLMPLLGQARDLRAGAEEVSRLIELVLPLRKTVRVSARCAAQGDVVFYLDEIRRLESTGVDAQDTAPAPFMLPVAEAVFELMPLPQVVIS